MLLQTDTAKDVLAMAAGMDAPAIEDLLGAMRGLLRQKGVQPGCRHARDPRPSRMFFVPEGVRYLDTLQLEALSRAVDQWVDKARTPQIRVSRRRLRLVYLMLRHSGAKVGEVLELDDTRDLDFAASEVVIRGQSPDEPDRRVILPAHFMEELRRFLDGPEGLGVRGRLFRLDQGFVRRKISEQSDRVPFPRELLNPTVLRHSRAVELLRQGVPLPVVQGMLGHASVVLTSGYYAFSQDDSRRILNHYIQKEAGMKTSARNTFLGSVASARAGELLTEVTVRTKSGKDIVSVITNESAERLAIAPGRNVAAIVKAPFVIVARDKAGTELSARNRFPGKVTRVRGDGLCTEVAGELDDGTPMCALITEESSAGLSLKPGDPAWFFFKAMSVILMAD